jgi:hypothetical protein
MKPGSDQDSCRNPPKKRLIAWLTFSLTSDFPRAKCWESVSRLHDGGTGGGHRIVIASQKAGRVYRQAERPDTSPPTPVPLLSPFLLHMFIARNATRTLKQNPRFTNLTTLRTFHTSLTNLNKMSEETKQQIKTAFPELLNIAKQKTTLPGREKDMTPIAKHTELECVAS